MGLFSKAQRASRPAAKGWRHPITTTATAAQRKRTGGLLSFLKRR